MSARMAWQTLLGGVACAGHLTFALLLWTGRHNDRPASYFLMAAVRGRAELSGPEALANRPDNSFELHWVSADRFAELGLHPPDIRGPLAELLAGTPSRTDAAARGPSQEDP